MGQTIDLNRKANVRQKTAADILSSSGLPVVAEYSADSQAGQTLIPASGSLPFAIDTSAPENVWIFVDGRRLRYGASNDFVFSQIDGAGFSSLIQLNAPIAANLSIQVSKLGIKKEVEFQQDARFAQIYDMATAAFQGMVDESARLTAVNGTPGAGQFRTFGIQNRASIPDLANDLRARMGVDRIPMQQIAEIQNEFGPNGERVYGLVNDDRNLVRFVGDWISSMNNADLSGGAHIDSFDITTANEYIEVVFYGTGLNVLYFVDNNSRDLRVTVDGGSEGANIIPNGSTVLSGRNYATNQVVNAVSGLSLGLHTVKLRDGSTTARAKIYGFEILNESANVNVRPGVAFVGGKKLVLSAASSVAYNSGFETVTREGAAVAFSSTRGARVIEYLKSDSTKGKAAYLTNAAQGNLGSADHTYEDVVRRFNFREFGAGRSDDFSTLLSSTSDRAFTLDDGTTTLVGDDAQIPSFGVDCVSLNQGTANSLTLTFVGTGLDIILANDGSARSFTVSVDGSASIGTISQSTAVTGKQVKVVSGLPYGTHVVRFNNGSGVLGAPGIVSFITYQPKKPTLPAGAVELADYCVMADYSFATATGTAVNDGLQMAVGTLSKSTQREYVYVGAGWSFSFNSASWSGFDVGPSDTSSTAALTFFGTGFVVHMNGSGAGTYDFSVTVDGALSASGVARANGSNLGGGSYRHTSAVSGTPCRIEFTGLSMGIHTVRIQKTAGAGNASFHGLHLITPIHSHKPNQVFSADNTLPIGSQGISDSRRLSLIKSEDPKKARVVCPAIVSSPSTSSGVYVPVPDMSAVVVAPAKGAWYSIEYMDSFRTSTANAAQYQIYVDGQAVGTPSAQSSVIAGANDEALSIKALVFLSAGQHKIDTFWKVSGGSVTSFNRQMTVEEL